MSIIYENLTPLGFEYLEWKPLKPSFGFSGCIGMTGVVVPADFSDVNPPVEHPIEEQNLDPPEPNGRRIDLGEE